MLRKFSLSIFYCATVIVGEFAISDYNYVEVKIAPYQAHIIGCRFRFFFKSNGIWVMSCRADYAGSPLRKE